MGDLVLTTFDWVPAASRGYARDLRIRWALEEAGLGYLVETVPFDESKGEHLAYQPIEEPPRLADGEDVFLGAAAILFEIGRRGDGLLPVDQPDRGKAMAWLTAAHDSVELASFPWVILKRSGEAANPAGSRFLAAFLERRLERLDRTLTARDWLAGGFSIADIAMADVLRQVERLDGLAAYPAIRAYVARATARPGFATALADQLAHFAVADEGRGGG